MALALGACLRNHPVIEPRTAWSDKWTTTVSLFGLMFLYAYVSTIGIVDSALSVRPRFESRSSLNIKNHITSFYDSKIFRDRSQVCLNTITYNNFCLKKTQFTAKKG